MGLKGQEANGDISDWCWLGERWLSHPSNQASQDGFINLAGKLTQTMSDELLESAPIRGLIHFEFTLGHHFLARGSYQNFVCSLFALPFVLYLIPEAGRIRVEPNTNGPFLSGLQEYLLETMQFFIRAWG